MSSASNTPSMDDVRALERREMLFRQAQPKMEDLMAPPPGTDRGIRQLFDNAFRAPRPGEFAPFAPLPNAPQPPVPDHLLPEAPRAPRPEDGIRQMQKRRGGLPEMPPGVGPHQVAPDNPPPPPPPQLKSVLIRDNMG